MTFTSETRARRAEIQKEIRRARIINHVTTAVSVLFIILGIALLSEATPDGWASPGAGSTAQMASSLLVFASGLLLPFVVLTVRGSLWARKERRRWDALMRAPMPESVADCAEPTLDAGQIAAAFTGRTPPERLSRQYRAALALVAVALATLLLIYVGLIALVVLGMAWHATTHVSLLGLDAPAAWRLILYAGPIGVGAILALFLIKPLVAPRIVEYRPHLATPETQPTLVEFVRRMADCVGAARPARIDLTCEANAWAGYASLREALRGRKGSMGLTLGLPLIAGLNAQELGHVVAHELAHCTQRQGMRLSAFIRSMTHWFARVIYERDMWDEMLSGHHSAGAGRVVMWTAWPFIRLTRGALWCLGWAGSAISSYFGRQLEFDADRCSVQAAGLEAFESGQRRILLLDFAASAAHGELAAAWERRRLCDNLPRFIVANVERLPKDSVDKALADTYKAKTQLFDSHPSPGLRLIRAKAVKPCGVFRLDGPGMALVRNFDPLARRLTYEFYRGMLGEAFVAGDLVSTDLFLREQNRFDDEAKALGRVSGGVCCMEPPVRFGAALESAPLPWQAPPAPEPPAQASQDIGAAAGAPKEAPLECDLGQAPDVEPLAEKIFAPPEGMVFTEETAIASEAFMPSEPPAPVPAPARAPEPEMTPPVTPPPAAWPADPEARLRLARERIEADAQPLRRIAQDQPSLTNKQINVEIAAILLGIGVQVAPRPFGLVTGTMDDALRFRSKLKVAKDGTCALLQSFLDVFVVRVESALALLDRPAVREKLPDADALAAEARRYVEVLRVHIQAWENFMSLHRDHAIASWAVGVVQKPPGAEFPVAELTKALKWRLNACHMAAGRIYERLEGATYPFEHGRGTVTLSDYVVGDLPEDEDWPGMLEKNEAILAKAPEVYYQILGRLAATCERVETALGLPPSPEPPKEPEPQPLP